MTIIRSAICAMVSSCVIITSVCPYSETQDFNIEITSNSVLESKFPVGSSAKIIAGRDANALAIATRYCCPPERVFGKDFNLSSIPILQIISITYSVSTFFPSNPMGSTIFSQTFKDGTKL